jgi:hypothetical protein
MAQRRLCYVWILLFIWFIGSGMELAPVQGYCLMIPGMSFPPEVYSWIVPYRWWDQIAVFDKFTACEERKMEDKAEALNVLGHSLEVLKHAGGSSALTTEQRREMDKGVKVLRRMAFAECVSVR